VIDTAAGQRQPSRTTDQRASALYEGSVRHRRFTPRDHRFRSKLFLAYLDLDELPALFDDAGRVTGLPGGPAAATVLPTRFRRTDYFDGTHDGAGATPGLSLAAGVRDLVAEHTGTRPTGPIRMLTHLRSWGYVFNPLTTYYVFSGEEERRAGDHDADDTPRSERLEAVVLEVTNIPWKERRHYVVPITDGDPRAAHWIAKTLHVSPFFGLDMVHRFSCTTPGERLWLRLENHRDGEKVFDADLSLRRHDWSATTLARLLVRHPLLTQRVTTGIHTHALRLAAKRVGYVPHPGKHPAGYEAAVGRPAPPPYGTGAVAALPAEAEVRPGVPSGHHPTTRAAEPPTGSTDATTTTHAGSETRATAPAEPNDRLHRGAA
jgi:hypothetical protein